MNVNDIKSPTVYPEDLLTAIFQKQHELATKYLDIEEDNGLLQTRDFPINIHDAKGQARFKDFCWRITEEIAEAMEAWDEGDMTHFQEELADSFHFFVEAMLLVDFFPDRTLQFWFETAKLGTNVDSINDGMSQFIVNLGLVCNCLKNKPWKKSQMMTDEAKFKFRLKKAFGSFIDFMYVSGFTAETLYDMYFRKNQVNHFRQESNY